VVGPCSVPPGGQGPESRRRVEVEAGAEEDMLPPEWEEELEVRYIHRAGSSG
jgi:hypothetical protein